VDRPSVVCRYREHVTQNLRVAMLAVHTSPLAQPGTGDAGGMNVYVARLAEALARRGADVEIFTRRTASGQPDVVPVPLPVTDRGEPGAPPEPGTGAVVVRHVTAGPFEGLDKADLPGQLCAFSAGVLRVAARLEAHRYDVVHSHYWLSGQSGWLAADRWGVPLVHSMHTMALVKNANLADGDVPEPMSRVIGEEQVVAEADMLIASTQEEADDLVIAYGADRARVRVVPPGVDLGTFRPPASPQERDALRARLGLDPARPVIVFAGRLQPLKGPDLLVRALGLMRRRSSSEAAGRAPSSPAGRAASASERVEPRGAHRAPLLVVLGGPSGRRTALAELRALAWQEGVLDDVRFLEPMTHDRLADWYRAADVVAVPSHSESFGLVALEAQAAGTPVVAAAVGGLRTVVADGRSGLLVPGHDPQRWADALGGLLGRLAHEPGTRAGLAAGARAQAERFTWDATAEGTLSAYRDARTRMPRRGAG